jgi:hypothetical protein
MARLGIGLLLVLLTLTGCSGKTEAGSGIAGKWHLEDTGLGKDGINSTLIFEGGKFDLAATLATTTGENAQLIAKGTFSEATGKVILNATSVDILGADLTSGLAAAFATKLKNAALSFDKAPSSVECAFSISGSKLTITAPGRTALTFIR